MNYLQEAWRGRTDTTVGKSSKKICIVHPERFKRVKGENSMVKQQGYTTVRSKRTFFRKLYKTNFNMLNVET